MIESEIFVFGKIIKRYKIPLDEIKDFNLKYESEKQNLNSFSLRLAGRLDSELEITHLLKEIKISKSIVDCMNDYIDNLYKANILAEKKSLRIISCWVNDMKEGEYNPPHTHHNLTGWSTVLFLKVPEFINDAKDPHKFRDGDLGFNNVNGISTGWMRPKVGEFYIFEASHQHCVMPFKTKIKGEVRRSMSFNFVTQDD